MKLIKDKKVVKFPSSKKSVKNILRDAVVKANKETWEDIIIITRDKDGTLGCGWSKMSHLQRIGMCEYAKHIAMRDMYES